jgi:hypothetical protein
MKTCKIKNDIVKSKGKETSKVRLAKVQEAVKCRDETVLKQLNSPSMWG